MPYVRDLAQVAVFLSPPLTDAAGCIALLAIDLEVAASPRPLTMSVVERGIEGDHRFVHGATPDQSGTRSDETRAVHHLCADASVLQCARCRLLLPGVGFPSGIVAHLHLSWLNRPQSGASRSRAQNGTTFDDMLIEGKLTIYDKGFDEDTRSWGEYIARSGDTFSPRIGNLEPLRIECEHFVECICTAAAPRSDGESGLRVVRVLEQLQHSLDQIRPT